MTAPHFAIETRRFSSKARTLQWLDRYAGLPVCLALSVVRRVADLLPQTAGTEGSQGILFVKLSEQGSTVLACDAVRTAGGPRRPVPRPHPGV